MRILRCKSLWTALIVFVGLSSLQPVVAQDSQESDAPFVVARVEGEPITEKQVYMEIEAIASRAKDQLSPQQFAQRKTLLFNHGLKRCIDNTLLDQAAKQAGIEVSEEELKEKVQDIREANGIDTDEKFQQFLQAQELTEPEFVEIVREQMLRAQILESKTPETKEPTEQQIATFYEENPKFFMEDEQVRASHILLQVKPDASEEAKSEAKEQLQDIKSNIVEGETTFAEAAKEHSDCPSKSRGGDLGYFRKGQMVPEFEQVAFAMEPGSLSDVVETKFGYHLIKVVDHKDQQKIALDQVDDKIKDYLEQKARQDKVVAYLESLREDAEIKELVTEEEWKQRQAGKAGGL